MLWHTPAHLRQSMPCGKPSVPFGTSAYRAIDELNMGRWRT